MFLQKEIRYYLFLGILLFHIVVTIMSFYSLFTDFDGLTTIHLYPLMLLVYTGIWAGIFFKNKWFAYLYFLISVFEIAMKLFFSKTLYGSVLGDCLFPANLIFLSVVVFMFNQQFKK